MNGKDEETKLMLFDPDEISNNENADRLIQETVKKIADTDVSFEYKEVTLNYEDWDVRRCIRAILPSNLDFRYSMVWFLIILSVDMHRLVTFFI